MANNLQNLYQTGVKFYASLNREQAKGLQSIGRDSNGNQIYVEPGAVCFVSDDSGNSIYLNHYIFGEANSSGSNITEINLNDIIVLKDASGNVTLADYFGDQGELITDKLVIQSENSDGVLQNTIVISKDGITIKGSQVITEDDLDSKLDSSEESLKQYINALLTSVYRIKGSVDSYEELQNIQNPSVGDVYNVSGNNYVYTDEGWISLGDTINLENYYDKDEITGLLNTLKSQVQGYTDGKITTVNNKLGQFEITLNNLNTANNNLNQKVTNNTTNISNLATQLTWQ